MQLVRVKRAQIRLNSGVAPAVAPRYRQTARPNSYLFSHISLPNRVEVEVEVEQRNPFSLFPAPFSLITQLPDPPRRSNGAELLTAHGTVIVIVLLIHKRSGFKPALFSVNGIERAFKLPIPIKPSSRIRHRVVDRARTGQSSRDIACVRGDFVRYTALMDFFLVGQSKMFGGRNITEKRSSVCSGRGRSDRRGDMIVAGRNISNDWT
jgi:hypothetical protein